MDKHVRDHLRDLNHVFYDTFAGSFSASRAETEPGFERILARIEPGSSVLDLGCGQARLARLLPANCTYVGVDYSEGMIQRAQDAIHPTNGAPTTAPGVSTRFIAADLVDGAWQSRVGSDFNWIMLRAVLQHVPEYASRRQVVRHACALLARQGRLVLANWQFLQIERLRRRILPWSWIGLTSQDVEPGDYLLDWRRQGHGLRYVHLIDEAETLKLARDLSMIVEAVFRADGHTNDLTLYAVLRS